MTSLNHLTARCNPEAIGHTLRCIGFTAFEADDLHAAGELARGGLTGGVAGGEAFEAVQATSRCAAYAFSEAARLTGVLAVIPLRPEGLARLEDDAFDSLDPDLSLVCRPGEGIAAVYLWGGIGATRRSKAAVLAGVQVLQDALDVPFFCRAATEDGRRVILGRLGYRPQPGSASGLYVRAPYRDLGRAA